MLQRHHTDGVRPPGIESKVSALEQQMARVNSSLESITTLLQRVVDPIEKHRSPQQPTTLPIGTNQVVFAPQTHGVAQDPVGISSAVDSLQAWVQRIASADINVNANANKGDDSEVQSWDDGDDGGKDAEGTMMMKEMLKSEEDARLEADGHIPLSGAKKRKFDSVSEYDEQRKMKPSVLDAIDIGLCSEADGRHLFNVFFRGAHGFMPVFDQLEDTWPSLRQRSPFSITAILFVGRKILDGGGPASKLQLQLREHAENIGKTTLFSPIATIEALQAMIILASWGDTGWRPGTHALSMAFDMELYKCLPKLAEQASKGRARNDKSTAATVVGARLWLLVTKMAIEMAYNHGRPLLLDTTDALAHTRALLTHPLALPTDSRIVAGCELLILRLPLHQIFLSGQERSLDTALKAFNEGSRQWEKRWTEFYAQHGVPKDDLLVTDLTTQSCFGVVLANSCLLRHIHSRSDVAKLPPQRREWLLSSLFAARLIANRILESEKDKLIYANHYSHVALASILRIYIRLTSLFPQAVDLRSTARELTQLADLLAQFPGVHFAHRLRDVIRKARQRRVLPAESRPSSPKGTTERHSVVSASSIPSPPSVFDTTTNHGPFDFDLFLAEHLLYQNAQPAPVDTSQTQQNNGNVNTANNPFGDFHLTPESHTNLSFSWGDFPPLGDMDLSGFMP